MQPVGIFDQSTDLDIPACGVECRDRPLVKDRPFEGQILAWRQAAFLSKCLFLAPAIMQGGVAAQGRRGWVSEPEKPPVD